MARVIELVPYSDRWPIRFSQEEVHILEALDGACLGIAHVGSTSVPGLVSKDTVDILATVYDLGRLDACAGRLGALGYRARGENGVSGRRYFVKYVPGDPERHAVHLHCFLPGHRAVTELLLFRDYLRRHPSARERYTALKRELASQYRETPAAYTAAKAEFIRCCLIEAERSMEYTAAD